MSVYSPLPPDAAARPKNLYWIDIVLHILDILEAGWNFLINIKCFTRRWLFLKCVFYCSASLHSINIQYHPEICVCVYICVCVCVIATGSKRAEIFLLMVCVKWRSVMENYFWMETQWWSGVVHTKCCPSLSLPLQKRERENKWKNKETNVHARTRRKIPLEWTITW